MAVAISDKEREFIASGVALDVRNDGRRRLDYRYVSVECGLLPQANGSARVILVHGGTDVLGAVKAEISEPAAHSPDEGRVEVSVECWSSVSPQFEGRGAQDINAQLTRTLSGILESSGAIDLKTLCIIPGKMCWVIHVDIVVLASGGSIMDSISLAAYAALNDTRLAKLYVVAGETPEDEDIEVDDDPDQGVPLEAGLVPVCITFSQIKGYTVVDATLEEEDCANAQLLVSINRKGNVCAVETSGSGGVVPSALHASLEAGRRVSEHLIKRVDAALEASKEIVTDTGDADMAGDDAARRFGDLAEGDGADLAGLAARGVVGAGEIDLPPIDMGKLTKLLKETSIERETALREAAQAEHAGFLA